MCGINGIIQFKKNSNFNIKQNILKMNNIIRHRGPDNQDISIQKSSALGHVRLSIIDLDKRSNQPLADESKNYEIIFNGEIYNYKEIQKELESKNFKFLTNSDTEVLLKGYIHFGEKILEKLQGFFSFCIHDKKRNIFFLARDSFGIKPLYYYFSENIFIFSSEIKSIITNNIDKSINYEGIKYYLSLGYIPNPMSPLKKIKQLEPGHYIRIENNFVKFKKFEPLNKNNNQSLYEIFDENITKSTISDVSVGLLLSSGLDSNIILHHCLKNKIEVHPVTVGFRNDKSYDETGVVKKILKSLNIKSKIIYLEDFDIKKLFLQTVYYQDNLNSNVANLALNALFKEASKINKVYLSGTGLDEMFGGYMTYKASILNDFIKFMPKKIFNFISLLINKINLSDGSKYNSNYLIFKFMKECCQSDEKSHLSWRTFWSQNDAEKILKRNFKNLDIFSSIIKKFKQDLIFDKSNNRMFLDYKYFLIDNQNMMIDNLSMMHSLEVRPCFLQQDIFKYAFSTESNKKFNLFTSKKILREIYKNKIPQEIIKGKKTGLVFPLKDILNSSLKKNTYEMLDNKIFNDIFDKNEINKVLKEFYYNKNNNYIYMIYNLLTLHEWSKKFILNQHHI